MIPLATLVMFLLALVPGCASAECTIRGSVYDWATFGKVGNAIIEVYSLPDITLMDQMVTTTGNYSFALPEGAYMIRASRGTPGSTDEIAAIENVTVPATGERTIDLVMFPLGNTDDLSGYVDDNATATLAPTESPVASPIPTPQQGGREDLTLFLGAGAILLAIIAIAAGLLFLRRNKSRLPVRQPNVNEQSHAEMPPAVPAPGPLEGQKKEPQVPQPPAETPSPDESSRQTPQQPPPEPQLQQPLPPSTRDLLLPQDCREVLAIMEKNGGRITQLDLRKAMPYSEAKVSLIVSDLESRGLVKKIKKGRGNVLILIRPGERPPE